MKNEQILDKIEVILDDIERVNALSQGRFLQSEDRKETLEIVVKILNKMEQNCKAT